MTPEGILLLGHSGFVGRSIATHLGEVFPEIYAVSRSRCDWEGLADIQSFECSLDDHAILKEILPRCRVVFHLASETNPGASALKPSLETASNLLPSLRFLECLQEYPHILLVFVSSGGAIYGNSAHFPVSEKVPLSPLSYYGAGKAAFEKFLLAFRHQTNGKVIILRPSNLYGPGQTYKPGFGIIPTLFHHILKGKTLEIWGDGETVRDYLYIGDFINLCNRILKSDIPGDETPVYNVGSGTGTTLNTLCSHVEEISGKTIKRRYQPARPVDVKSIVLDCSRIKEQYQWEGGVDLRTGLSKTWEWFCNQDKRL